MVETNQEPVNHGSIKKKKQLDKKADYKKSDIKPAEKKPQVKKDAGLKAPAFANKLSLAGAKKFLRGAWFELKKVHWPTRRELIAFTGVVLVAVAFVAVLLFLIDSVLGAILDAIIPK